MSDLLHPYAIGTLVYPNGMIVSTRVVEGLPEYTVEVPCTTEIGDTWEGPVPITEPVPGSDLRLDDNSPIGRDIVETSEPIPNPFTLVRVTWRNHRVSKYTDWVTRGEITVEPAETIVTVGYVVESMLGYTMLAQTITFNGAEHEFHGIMQVPDEAIQAIQRLVVVPNQ